MTTRTKQVWPSPENSQFTMGTPVNANSLLSYLRQVLDKLPPEQQATAVFVGAGDVRLLADHTLTPLEIREEQMDLAREYLAQNTGPLSEMQRAELLRILSPV